MAHCRAVENAGALRLRGEEGSVDAASRGSSDFDETAQRHYRGVFETSRVYVTE